MKTTMRLLMLLALLSVWMAIPASAQTTTTTTVTTTTTTLVYEGNERYSYGTLVSAQAADGTSAYVVGVQHAGVLRFSVTIAGTATVTIQAAIPGDAFADLTTPAPRGTTGLMDIPDPAGGLYRAKITSCAGCTVTVKYVFLPR